MDWSAKPQIKIWMRAADALVLVAKRRQIDPLKLAKISRFEVKIVLSEKHTRADADNCVKALIDYLRRIELIEDDSPKHMRRLIVEWGDVPEGCRVTVTPLA